MLEDLEFDDAGSPAIGLVPRGITWEQVHDHPDRAPPLLVPPDADGEYTGVYWTGRRWPWSATSAPTRRKRSRSSAPTFKSTTRSSVRPARTRAPAPRPVRGASVPAVVAASLGPVAAHAHVAPAAAGVLADVEEQPAARALSRALPDPLEWTLHQQLGGRPGHRPACGQFRNWPDPTPSRSPPGTRRPGSGPGRR